MGRSARTAEAGSSCGTPSPRHPAPAPSRHAYCPEAAKPLPHTGAGTAEPVFQKQHGRPVLRPGQTPVPAPPAPPVLGQLGLAVHWAFADSSLDPAKAEG